MKYLSFLFQPTADRVTMWDLTNFGLAKKIKLFFNTDLYMNYKLRFCRFDKNLVHL